jgi:uncharacterized surface protein with fasciclin (FAS1) repeats
MQVPNVEQIAAASGYATGMSQLTTVLKITALLRGSNASTLLVIDNSSSSSNGSTSGGAYYPEQEACSTTASDTTSDSGDSDTQYEQLLRYHVLQGAQSLSIAGDYSTAATVDNSSATAVVHVQWARENVGHPFTPAVTGLYVNAAEVTELQPIQALNGVIWRLAQPLAVPAMTLLQLLHTDVSIGSSSSSSADTTATMWGQWLSSDSELSAMLNDATAGPFTVFAPSGELQI